MKIIRLIVTLLFFCPFSVFAESISDYTGEFEQSGNFVKEEDENKDGKIDTWEYALDSGISLIKKDFNADGKPNLMWLSRANGADGDFIDKRLIDFNSDGRWEGVVLGEANGSSRSLIDENGDGQIESWGLKGGEVSVIGSDLNNDQKIDSSFISFVEKDIHFWEADTDFDGIFEMKTFIEPKKSFWAVADLGDELRIFKKAKKQDQWLENNRPEFFRLFIEHMKDIAR